MEGILKISDGVPPGLVRASFVWSEDSRHSAASLIGPLIKGENFKVAIPVRIERGK
jgi:hypothetical protein